MRKLLLLAAVLCSACSMQPVSNTDEPIVLDWEVTEEVPGPYDQPRTSLALVLSGGMEKRVELGTYAGSFADGNDVQTIHSLVPKNSLMMAMFWWAGAGDEVIVGMYEPGILSILHRTIDEQVEPGEFEEIETVRVPTDAYVEAGAVVK